MFARRMFFVSTIICSALTIQVPPAAAQQSQEQEIDFDKARELMQKSKNGGKLTAEESKYLERARAARQTGNDRKQTRTIGSGKSSVEMTPLSDLGADDSYLGEEGGLYGEGKNTPPESHLRAAEIELQKIVPRDANGNPDPNGKIVFVSISMSNATQEFSTFKKVADASQEKSDRVVVVDCAQGGQAMSAWAPADAKPWQVAEERLKKAGVTNLQVQTAWIKLANPRPTGDLQEHGTKLKADTLAVLHNAKQRFPNLRIAYLASRTYGGYAATPLNPEPYAYESAIVARWLIKDQMSHDSSLNFDPARGEVNSPLLLWGPYLWANGTKGRKTDDLIWLREDFVGDGTHPSESGRMKVTKQLMTFLTTDPLAKSWFAKK